MKSLMYFIAKRSLQRARYCDNNLKPIFQAVSTAAALSDRYCIQNKTKNIDPLSHQYMVACDTTNYGCWGGFMHRVNNFMVNNGTITGGEYESDEVS